MDNLAPRPLYLAGRWVTTNQHQEVVDPATGAAFARVCMGERAHVAQAFAAAYEAFGGWRMQSAKHRALLLLRLAAALEAETENLANVITQENGKPLAQSRAEVAMTVDHLTWFAEEGKRAYGRLIPHQVEGKRHMAMKAPVGPVGVICPWNFPLALVVRKAAPAWAAGCSVVIKPAQQTPLSALELARLAHEVGFPMGLISVVLAPAAEVGAEMLNNPLCRKISFTGSTAVGQKLIAGAAASIKPLALELGGHAPLLVFDDAHLDQAVAGAIAAKFRNSGQACIAANRIFVQRGIYDAFLERFVAKVGALKLGPGTDLGTDIGPLIDAKALAKAERHIEDAVARGAAIAVGGKRLARDGNFLEPTVLINVPAAALCLAEETFAPIAPVSVFDTEAEAIQRANDSLYGLAAYAFTRDLGRTFRLAEDLEAGTVSINEGLPTSSQAPFGGMKHSGWGRELGSKGLDAFLETKHICVGIT